MSATKDIQDSVYEWARAGTFNAPYGVLTSETTNKDGRKYRSVTFGRARTLDVEVRIYGPSFIMVRSSRHGQQIFKSKNSMQEFLDTL